MRSQLRPLTAERLVRLHRRPVTPNLVRHRLIAPVHGVRVQPLAAADNKILSSVRHRRTVAPLVRFLRKPATLSRAISIAPVLGDRVQWHVMAGYRILILRRRNLATELLVPWDHALAINRLAPHHRQAHHQHHRQAHNRFRLIAKEAGVLARLAVAAERKISLSQHRHPMAASLAPRRKLVTRKAVLWTARALGAGVHKVVAEVLKLLILQRRRPTAETRAQFHRVHVTRKLANAATARWLRLIRLATRARPDKSMLTILVKWPVQMLPTIRLLVINANRVLHLIRPATSVKTILAVIASFI